MGSAITTPPPDLDLAQLMQEAFGSHLRLPWRLRAVRRRGWRTRAWHRGKRGDHVRLGVDAGRDQLFFGSSRSSSASTTRTA